MINEVSLGSTSSDQISIMETINLCRIGVIDSRKDDPQFRFGNGSTLVQNVNSQLQSVSSSPIPSCTENLAIHAG